MSGDNAWDELLAREGAWGAWRRMRSCESFRSYYRRWPFDDQDNWLPLHGGDYYDERASGEPERIGQEYDFEILLRPMTKRQRRIATLIAHGYKPRDIAALEGKDDSGAVRWMLWSVRRKLQEAI